VGGSATGLGAAGYKKQGTFLRLLDGNTRIDSYFHFPG
jgi:hypothetical protein